MKRRASPPRAEWAAARAPVHPSLLDRLSRPYPRITGPSLERRSFATVVTDTDAGPLRGRSSAYSSQQTENRTMTAHDNQVGHFPVSRRVVLGASTAAAATAPLMTGARPASAITGAAEAPPVSVRTAVNGKKVALRADSRVTLLDALREQLGLTGTKKGCDRGQCGACTVHIDGRRVLSCLTLLATTDGREVTTIEGLSVPARLHPVQRAFIDHDGFQCGFCTSGQIMSAVGMVNEGAADTEDEIREQMSGNICRCSAYPGIVAAIQQAQGEMR